MSRVIEEEVEVVRVDGAQAWVTARSDATCGGCATSCPSQKFMRMYPRQMMVGNSLHAMPGQRVIVALPSDSLLRLALVFYGLPLFFFLAGLLFASFLLSSPGPAVAGQAEIPLIAFLFLSLGFLLARILGRRLALAETLQPVMVRLALHELPLHFVSKR